MKRERMFTDNVKVMLYVQDVAKSLDFWTSLGFIVSSQTDIEGYQVAEMKSHSNSSTTFGLFSLEFIEKFSPEVSRETPSIMFDTDDLDGLYSHMQEQGIETTPISETGTGRSFAFPDNDGNYFAVSQAS